VLLLEPELELVVAAKVVEEITDKGGTAKAFKADIPFLMISGYPSHSTAVNIMKHGASDYLPKPFTLEELTRRVGYTLKLNALSKPLAPAKGIILGAVISTTMWMLIIGAILALSF